MLCRLCSSFYIEEESFENLFNFDSICENCKIKYEPKLNFEIIPIDLGEIHYYYLYENIKLNLSQSDILDKYLDIIYRELINQKNNYGLVVFLDDNLLNNIIDLKIISSNYTKTFLFSLERKELLYQDIF
ncbi:MAG: hypothetical protein K9L64_02115 [Candidatus Izimaplasma sp.]|nr:hypothetical protein [Candidatus Izimaplasma bacterium]